jgi:hypothetical protein
VSYIEAILQCVLSGNILRQGRLHQELSVIGSGQNRAFTTNLGCFIRESLLRYFQANLTFISIYDQASLSLEYQAFLIIFYSNSFIFQMLSVAIFAPGWTHECLKRDGERCYPTRDSFNNCFYNCIRTVQLTIFLSNRFLRGTQISLDPFFNLVTHV